MEIETCVWRPSWIVCSKKVRHFFGVPPKIDLFLRVIAKFWYPIYVGPIQCIQHLEPETGLKEPILFADEFILGAH